MRAGRRNKSSPAPKGRRGLQRRGRIGGKHAHSGGALRDTAAARLCEVERAEVVERDQQMLLEVHCAHTAASSSPTQERERNAGSLVRQGSATGVELGEGLAVLRCECFS